MNQAPLEPLEAVAVDLAVGPSTMLSNGSTIFGFESDLERSLTCIPLAVRFKLDKCGIKLSLRQWQELSLEDRQGLLEVRCESQGDIANYRRFLQALIMATSDREPRVANLDGSRPWEAPEVPEQLQRKTLELGAIPPAPSQWRALAPLQRFALIKLSREGDHARNLMPALREFELL